MKKTKTSFIVLSALVAAIALSSCANNTPDETKHVAKVVDLRNKKGNAISFSRSAARAADAEFSSEFLKTVPRFIGENGVETNHPSFLDIKDVKRYNPNDEEFNKILAAVKIEDHKDGVKFTFKRMAGFEDVPYKWVNVQFLDDVGHKSTGISFDPNNKTSLVDSTTGTVEIIYPLVDPTRPNKNGKETRFWIQLTTDKYYADLSYKVVPKNGHGCVENVQEDYNIRDYLKLSEDGVMSLELTIPPIAKADTLKHNVGIYVQKTSDPQYTEKAGNPVNTNLGISEAASEAEINAAKDGKVVEYKVDLKEFYAKLTEEQKNGLNTMLKDNPYVWVSLTYNYKVDIPGLEDYVFDTPWVISNVISNPFAAK